MNTVLRIVTFLFNCFFWILDALCWILETLVEAFGLFVNFLLTVGTDFTDRLMRLFQYQTWTTPVREKPFDGSYIMRGVRMLAKFGAQTIFYACLLEAFPDVRAFFATLGLFFRRPSVSIFIIVCAFIFLLPQQQLFRDPVTRVFFRTGRFKNYGQATFYAKLLSFVIITALFCTVWIP